MSIAVATLDRRERNIRMPHKWMALESMNGGMLSEKTDVVYTNYFSVVLWSDKCSVVDQIPIQQWTLCHWLGSLQMKED